MGYSVQQSTTTQPLVFFMTDSSDHITGKTGLTPTVTISKNGGSFASPSGSVSAIGNGWYEVAGNATDNNTLGPLLLHATATGADPCDDCFPVVAYAPQDAIRLGLTALPGTACVSNASLITVGTGTAQLNVSGGLANANLIDIVGSAVSAGAAQLGVNVVGWDGAGVTGTGGVPDVNVDTVNGSSTAAVSLAAQSLACVVGTVNDSSPTAGGFVGSSGLSSTVGDYNRSVLVFTSGVNQGLGRAISGYSGSTTKTFSFTGTTNASDGPFPAAPANADSFIIIGRMANGT